MFIKAEIYWLISVVQEIQQTHLLPVELGLWPQARRVALGI